MFPIRARHTAALGVAAATLLTSGFVVPAAFAEPDVHDDTIASIVPMDEGSHDETQAADEIAPDVDPIADGAPAPSEPEADAGAPEAPAAAALAAPPAGSASLSGGPTIPSGDAMTLVADVEASTSIIFVALGDELSVRIASGEQVIANQTSVDGRVRFLDYAADIPAGPLTITIVNLGDTRVVPFGFGSAREGVSLGMSTATGLPRVATHVAPVVDGVARRDYTAESRLILPSGEVLTQSMVPVGGTSHRSNASFDELPVGDYVVENRVTIDGITRSWASIASVAPVDETPPVVTMVPDRSSNANGWYRGFVVANISASDPESSVQTVHVSVDGGAYTTHYRTSVDVLVETEGVHELSYYATNYQGLQSSPATRLIRVDTTSPLEPAITGLEDGAEVLHGAEVIVEYTCDDALSGVREADCIGTAPSGSALDTTTPGTHTFEVVATDRAGNITRASRSYVVSEPDTAAPVVEVTHPAIPASGWFTEPVTVRITATDGHSGVREINWEVAVPGGMRSGTSRGGVAELLIEDTGEHTVSFWAVDEAGNRTESQSISLSVDVDAPTVDIVRPADGAASILPNGDFELGERIGVQYSCDDHGSGIASCEGPTFDGGLLDTSRIGTHEFTVVATDVAGNRTERTVTYVVAAAAVPAAGPVLAFTGIETLLPGLLLVSFLFGASALMLTLRSRGVR